MEHALHGDREEKAGEKMSGENGRWQPRNRLWELAVPRGIDRFEYLAMICRCNMLILNMYSFLSRLTPVSKRKRTRSVRTLSLGKIFQLFNRFCAGVDFHCSNPVLQVLTLVYLHIEIYTDINLLFLL